MDLNPGFATLLTVGQWAGGLAFSLLVAPYRIICLPSLFLLVDIYWNACSWWHCAFGLVCNRNNHVFAFMEHQVCPGSLPCRLLAFTLLPLDLLLDFPSNLGVIQQQPSLIYLESTGVQINHSLKEIVHFWKNKKWPAKHLHIFCVSSHLSCLGTLSSACMYPLGTHILYWQPSVSYSFINRDSGRSQHCGPGEQGHALCCTKMFF